MKTNWIIISAVVVFGIALVIYLIWKNLKDEKDVVNYFEEESSNFHEDEDEFNDDK